MYKLLNLRNVKTNFVKNGKRPDVKPYRFFDKSDKKCKDCLHFNQNRCSLFYYIPAVLCRMDVDLCGPEASQFKPKVI